MMATTNLLVRLNRCRMKSSCRSKTTIEDTSRILRSRLSPTRDHRPRSGPPSQRSRNPPDPTLPRPSAISPIPMGRSSSTTPPMAGTTAARRLRLPADRDPWSPLQVTVYMAAPAEHGTKAGYSFPDTTSGCTQTALSQPDRPERCWTGSTTARMLAVSTRTWPLPTPTPTRMAPRSSMPSVDTV